MCAAGPFGRRRLHFDPATNAVSTPRVKRDLVSQGVVQTPPGVTANVDRCVPPVPPSLMRTPLASRLSWCLPFHGVLPPLTLSYDGPPSLSLRPSGNRRFHRASYLLRTRHPQRQQRWHPHCLCNGQPTQFTQGYLLDGRNAGLRCVRSLLGPGRSSSCIPLPSRHGTVATVATIGHAASGPIRLPTIPALRVPATASPTSPNSCSLPAHSTGCQVHV
ncbi:hypothetical protein B0T14DRAFT_123463 [Immersiella caudata]|uniref:Uncharacterized protein n=1 Tax=Immersiella caudata TaxID=314043 RepID=A0AA40C6I0_9PEZI|nr:hypothetical protein B0T14DRAFT_123463 [Immersiella caudata]